MKRRQNNSRLNFKKPQQKRLFQAPNSHFSRPEEATTSHKTRANPAFPRMRGDKK
jgi:hypothetical protein